MNLTDIANTRLVSQQIAGTKFKSVKEVVGWMGAMQAQDYKMAKWAIGLRASKATEKIIDAAIDSGEIIRTHVLRPTWHFVVPEDICWMTELTAPRIKASMKSRNVELELDEKVFKKANAIFEKTLRDGNHLTRPQLLLELNKAKIATDGNRSSHLLFNAELDGIICSGKTQSDQITYALLKERIPQPKKINKEEALYKLAEKYFESHCPATLQDFAWWSGLSVTDAKKAVEMIQPNFSLEKINEKTYLFPGSFFRPKKVKESVFLLPAFDEFLISYKDRTAALELEHHSKAFSINGIFWPTIVINGQVAGIWKRTIKKDKVIIESNYFVKTDKNTKVLIEKASEKFGHFLQKKVETTHGIYSKNQLPK